MLNQIQQNKKNKHKAFLNLCLIFFLMSLFFSYNIGAISAEMQGKLEGFDFGSSLSDLSSIKVADKGTKKEVQKSSWKRIMDQIKDWAKTARQWGIIKTGSMALGTAVKTALNQIAYDTATWIGSGKTGQKPLFITEGWGEYLGNIADNEAGAFIEKFGKGTFGEKFNVCEPSLDVKYKIGLGLVQVKRPEFAKPNCSASEMIKSWGEFSEDFKEKTLLNFVKISPAGPVNEEMKYLVNLIADTDYINSHRLVVESLEKIQDQIKNLKGDNNDASIRDKIYAEVNRLLERLENWHKKVYEDEKIAERNGETEKAKNLKSLDEKILYQIAKAREFQSQALAPTTDEKKLKDLASPDFLQKFQSYFNPESNDLGIALSSLTTMSEKEEEAKDEKTKERIAGGGWLDVRNIAGRAESVPDAAKDTTKTAREIQMEKLGNFTGDALVDAANVFLNQLAITAFNKYLASLGKDKPPTTSPYGGDYGLADYAGAPTKGGVAGAKEKLKGLIEPDFAERGDYNILAELTMCPTPTKAGPTNCVIDNKLSQAISDRKTVGEALKDGSLNSNGVFGFSSNGLEPNYNEGYSYRSMLILRKFRILPVGWEVGAQYIKASSTDSSGNLTDVGKNNTLGKLVACFAKEDDYSGYYDTWCDGLVDPNWVLKAPQNYCKREGPGPEITSAQVIGEGASSQLMITRNDKYCADEQSCIKESDNGACQYYGYCNEERRTWKFNSKSCEPRDNTCQTFRTSDNKTVSYLENSLDYGKCSIDNVGCNAYATSSTAYLADNDTVRWASSSPIYLDKDVQTCKQTDEGCNEFIRLKSGTGANLLINANFEDDFAGTVWDGAGTQVEDGYNSFKALKLTQSLNKNISVGPNDYSVAGELFSLSFYAKNCGSGDSFQIADQKNPTQLNEGADWQAYQASYVMPADADDNKIKIIASSTSCVIDNIKLERGDPTAYSDYGKNGLIYQKYAPTYLKCDGIKDPAKCDNYVMDCEASDVGCELYTSIKDDINIPGRVNVKDYCPDECVGYDTYIQSQTAFDFLRDAYFIPKTAKTCSASAVGCDEFTNLDELGKGAEAKEYYSALRQCIKPDQNQCAEFYSWEGSDESGFQLRVVNLKKKSDNSLAVIEEDNDVCNETIYKLSSADPMYQPNCRQFYNREGQIFYHLINNTISCSDNCHPYRLTAVNNDPTIISYNACSGPDKNWNASSSQCMVCKSKGVWNDEQSACVYMAIPSQGATCSAGQNGCREYSGNTGNNLRFVLNNDFEGSTQGWTGVNGTTVEQDNTSVIAGGHSLKVSGGSYSAEVIVGNNVIAGKDYVLSFIAKTNAVNQLAVKIANGSATSTFVATALYNDDNWHAHKVNLNNLDHEPNASEKLIIKADNIFYIDDIRLTEVVDRYYLIKDSWKTPDVCDESYEGEYSPLYMLGCEAYHDRDNNVHNLHSFSSLCKDSAVGCELMIDTKNSNDYKEKTFNSDDPDSKITVQADEFKYVVYDKKKQCNVADKGCSRLGKFYKYENSFLFGDIYLKNNPDKYNEILCSSAVVGCQEWSAGDNNGSSYFKDPGDMVCEWQQGAGSASGNWGWYKKKIKRCGSTVNANVCLTDKDCLTGTTCQQETEDIACKTSSLKTFGTGGAPVDQPDKDNNGSSWAGLCKASSAGCSEYIDPISKFAMDIASTTTALEPNTLYILKNSIGNSTVANCKDIKNDSSVIYELTNENKLSSATSSLTVRAGSKRFYSGESVKCDVSDNDINKKAELRRAVVGYQFKQDLDKDSCNGIVDFEQGCILFNERVQSGSKLVGLNYDADKTFVDGNGVSPESGATTENNSNTIIKVSPDRVCDKWLACRDIKSTEEEKVCLGMGVCNKFDDEGKCGRFLDSASGFPENQTFGNNNINANTISNMSGYTKVGWANSKVSVYPNDYYKFGEMKTFGISANVPNWDFEDVNYDASNTPIIVGWSCDKDGSNNSVCEIIGDPVKSERNENICFKKENKNCVFYAPSGKSFLKIKNKGGSNYTASTTAGYEISVAKDKDYVLTAYINTSKITDGKAVLSIIGFTDQGVVAPTEYNKLLKEDGWTVSTSYSMGAEWKLVMFHFKTGAITSAIKIKLSFTDGATGTYYIDDIGIKPALKSYDLTPNNSNDNNFWYTRQSCQLYPKEDSLSCDYYEDSGIRNKGKYGYCLEYDRYPGNSNACLLWWPTPNEAERFDEYCGDGFVDGEEDCDCGKDSSGKIIYDCFNGPLPAGATSASTPSPYGTHKNNQYQCAVCRWTNGWCGDGVIQSDTNSEHCDWNDENTSLPNLKEQTCWSDHSKLGDLVSENPNHYAQQDFSHDGYTDYLYGNLGCYDNRNSDKRCRFNASGCSDSLVNNRHTRKDCDDAGGKVVNKDGEEVTDGNGKISDRDKVGNEFKDYFCKFTNNSCANITGGGGGWTQYKSWSATQSIGGSSTWETTCDCDTQWVIGSSGDCRSRSCGCTQVGNNGHKNIIHQPNEHAFGNIAHEHCYTKCEYDVSNVGCDNQTQELTTYAAITAIGCY